MNREFKFRAWDLKLKSWITHSITISAEFRIFQMFIDDSNKFHCFPKSKDEIVIQQFTGFKDANGKEIFEGDIVTICVDDNPEDPQWELIPITFEWGSFWVGEEMMPDLINSQEEASWERLFDLEVIGNIFENPELLK